MEPRHPTKHQERKAKHVLKMEREKSRRLILFFCAVIGIFCAFVVGFLVRSNIALMTSLGIPVAASEAADTSSSSNKTVYDSISQRVAEVEDMLSEYSLDSMHLDQATSSMLEGLMKATDDPFAVYFSPERYNTYIKETTERTYKGIGVLFSEYNGRAYASDVFEGSEAEAKGVQQGDYVVAIDGDSSKTWTVTEVVNALSDMADDSVVITWMRPSSLDAETGFEFTTTLTYNDYTQENVTTDLVSDTIGIIAMHQITQNASELIAGAIDELASQGAEAYILDLRGCPGGYLTQAVDIASLFLKSGIVVEIKTVEGVTTKTVSGATLTDAPLVVLVNQYTAAAAEVLTAALADNQRATVVGSTTAGKGSVQVTRELSFGGAIRYTAAYYLTPLGRDINGVGIIPEVAVTGSDDAQAQRLVAIDTARSLIHNA